MSGGALKDTGSATDLRPATCVRHPNGSKEIHFCFDCSRVFCGDCRAIGIERVNHLTHRTAPLQKVLTQRKKRMPAIRKLIGEYVKKHDTMLSALQKLEKEMKAQAYELNEIIDDFASKLCRQIERTIQEAKATITRRAAEIWSANPAESARKEIEKELQKMCSVRAAIDLEVRLCDRDELYLVEKNKDMESFANELSEFQAKAFEIPDTSCYHLSELRRELTDQMTQMQRELDRATDTFLTDLQHTLPFPQSDTLTLLPTAVITFPKEKLLCQNDTRVKSLLAYGAIPSGDQTNSIYFVDVDNSKIKMLDLKTSQLTELFSGRSGTQLKGLANVEEKSNCPLVATTEHTYSYGTPARVRLLLLRRNDAESLKVVQSVVLDETASSWTSIVQFASGNVFCAIRDSEVLHELRRPSDASPSPNPFESTARTHRLPEKVSAICSLQSNGECRLAASFADDTLRVFRVAGGALCELQRIPPPCANWSPFMLVALPGGSMALRISFTDPSDLKQTYGIEFCAAQPDGPLAAPKRLLTLKYLFALIGLLPPTDSFPNFRLVTFDFDNNELCLYHIKSD